MMDLLKKLRDFICSFLKKPEQSPSSSCSHGSQKGTFSGSKSESSSLRVDIYSPCDGEIVPQKDIPDEGFSEGHMGQGLGIKPTSSSIKVFMSGTLEVLFKTKHAYVIKDGSTGVSVMLHLGINTVNIPEEKKPFETNRKQSDVLKAKESLCEMNLEVVEKEATSIVSALLVQNENMDGKKVLYHVSSGSVKAGDLLMSVVSA